MHRLQLCIKAGAGQNGDLSNNTLTAIVACLTLG